MLKRIPAPVFWVVLMAVVLALGYSIFAALQPEDAGLDSRSTATTGKPSPAARRAPPRRSTPHAGAPPGAIHPALTVHATQTVALATQAGVMPAGRWAPDKDFAYSGHWEHVTGHFDGRTGGSSSRSFVPGSRAELTFDGRSIRLYGVVGPGGGLGTVDIDGRVKRMVDFYAATKTVHKLIFASPALAPGTHHLTLSVIIDQALPVERSHYVNIDGAEINT